MSELPKLLNSLVGGNFEKIIIKLPRLTKGQHDEGETLWSKSPMHVNIIEE